jgi:5-methylcytosine-specific restriction endonuclease McrA
MSASDTFASAKDFVARIQSLRQQRRAKKRSLRGKVPRRALSKSKKASILKKAGGRCHICGGPIDGEWQADHVLAHALGGGHDTDNYLPAHSICNNYRWFYEPEELQWILKLGVWLRNEIEKESRIGRDAAVRFHQREQTRAGRRKASGAESDAASRPSARK